jgi:hypothetical protein
MTDHGLIGVLVDWLRARPSHALWFVAATLGSLGAAVALFRWRATRFVRAIKNK